MFRKRKNTSILPDLIFSKFFLIFCVFVFVGILFALAKGTVRNYRVDSEIQQLQDEIGMLEGQNKEYAQLINYLNSEAFVEQEAKLNRGLKKTGENLVVIPEENLTEEIVNIDSTEDLSNPFKWWVYFFDKT